MDWNKNINMKINVINLQIYIDLEKKTVIEILFSQIQTDTQTSNYFSSENVSLCN